MGQIKFSNSPTLSNAGTGTAVGILPYLFGDNSPSGNGTDLVTYNSSYGVCLLSSSQYSSSVAAGTNVKLASSPAAVSANTSILGLVLTNSGSATQLSDQQRQSLTLASGALLSTGSAANSITGGTLTFGTNSATTYEGIVHTASNLTIGSAVTNNGSNAVSVTKSGPGTLFYSGANTYSGGTTVGGGTLQVSAGGSLISGGAITVSGGGNGAGLQRQRRHGLHAATAATPSTSAISPGRPASSTFRPAAWRPPTPAEPIMLGDFGTGIWNQTGGTTTVANQFLVPTRSAPPGN